MALPMLAGGAECGPSNPLQTLAKRFDHDRGLQQDYFGTNRAGSSGVSIRSYTAGPSTSDQEVAQFFASQPTSHALVGPSLDLSSLRETLPAINFHTNVQQHPTADWAADFAHSTEPGQVMMVKGGFSSQAQHGAPASSSDIQLSGISSLGQVGTPWNQAMSGFRMNTAPMYLGPTNAPMQALVRSQIDQTSWDKEFTSQEQQISQEIETGPVDSQIQQPSDELARTAAMLLEQVKHEQNPKFKNSQFMDLMRHLRDGKVVIEGNQMIEAAEGTVLQSDTKGKGRAVDDLPNFAHLTTSQTTFPQNIALVVDGRQEAGSRQEDPNDAYFRQDNEDYIRYWAEKNIPLANPVSASETEWDILQADWDRFDATAAGIQKVHNYPFQANNPYLLGDSSRFRTTQHGHQSMIESILELEAAVQRDMNNNMAWYHLGIKQQENEREHKALQALKHAVELDPSHLPSWLALAVSYTNDSNRTGAYDSILAWMNRNEKYKDALPLRSQISNDSGASLATRYEGLINSLIALARSNRHDQIDADIQIALGVLLNSNEDYEKAEDCFRTALALRPDDWLLYNRVGATLANSGHAEEALQYYHRALELNPGYIRARYNLGISCINLRRPEEAAQHILDALVLQENDGTAGQNRGVTSSALWDSLKTACQNMRRVDLAAFCDRRDLDALRSTFH